MGNVDWCKNVSLKLSKKNRFEKRTKNAFLFFEDTRLLSKTQLVSGVAMSLSAAYYSLVRHITCVDLRFLKKVIFSSFQNAFFSKVSDVAVQHLLHFPVCPVRKFGGESSVKMHHPEH